MDESNPLAWRKLKRFGPCQLDFENSFSEPTPIQQFRQVHSSLHTFLLMGISLLPLPVGDAMEFIAMTCKHEQVIGQPIQVGSHL